MMTKIIILIFVLVLSCEAFATSINPHFGYFNKFSYSTATCSEGTELSISSFLLDKCVQTSNGKYAIKTCELPESDGISSDLSDTFILKTNYFSDADCLDPLQDEFISSSKSSACNTGIQYTCSQTVPVLENSEQCHQLATTEGIIQQCGFLENIGATLVKVSPFVLFLAYITSLFF